MNLRLLRALNQLADATQAFLNDPDLDVDRWETYLARRGVIFTELQDLTCSEEDLLEPSIASRKEEIFRQEALVHERALAKLADLKTELRTLAAGRRALHGYGAIASPILVEPNS